MRNILKFIIVIINWLLFSLTAQAQKNPIQMCKDGNIGVCVTLQKSYLKKGDRTGAELVKEIKCSQKKPNSYISFIIDCPGEEQKAITLCKSNSFDMNAQFACSALAEYKNDSSYKALAENKKKLWDNSLEKDRNKSLKQVVNESKNNSKPNKLSHEQTEKLLSFCLGYLEAKNNKIKVDKLKNAMLKNNFKISENDRLSGKSAANPNDKKTKAINDFDKAIGQTFYCDSISP